MPRFRILAILLVVTSISTPVYSQIKDPLEWWNRPVFQLNDFLDKLFLRPVTQVYRFVLPGQVERGVSNFFDNLSEPVSVLNSLVQVKPGESGLHLARFSINSTLGVAGFFDVAAIWSINPPKEDFDQSLAILGIPSGPYLIMPLLGPGTVRSWIAEPFDMQLEILTYYPESTSAQLSLRALDFVSDRADLLQYESMLSGDRYQAVKDLYQQTREFEIQDGSVADEFSADTNEESEFVDETF